MKSIIDRDSLRKRASFAHTATLAGLFILIGTVAISLWQPSQTTVLAVLLFLGFAVSAVGVFLANRWVKKPRPEDVLDKTLKPLSDQFRLYHYHPFGDHLLLTPSGVLVIDTVNLEGLFEYTDHRWKQKFSMSRALRYVFEERLGNPTQRAQDTAAQVSAKLSTRLQSVAAVPTSAMVVFIHPAAELKVKEPPIPVCIPKNLHKRIPVTQARIPHEQYLELRSILDETAGPKALA